MLFRSLEEENSLELDWNEREEIIRRETIPPADDDILGHVKVHIDQYFGVYTQLLTDNSDPDYPLEDVYKRQSSGGRSTGDPHAGS